MIGADVKLYTPTHPLSPEARNGLSGPEAAKPITIGTDCWLCGGMYHPPWNDHWEWIDGRGWRDCDA